MSVCWTFPPLFHFSSSAHWFIQVWDGTEGLTQPAARQRLHSAVSIIQIPYLPWVLWDHHNAMSPSQKSIHTLWKMLFCKWKRCLTDVAQTRVTYTVDTCRMAGAHTQRGVKRNCFVSFWDFLCQWDFDRSRALSSFAHHKMRTHSHVFKLLTECSLYVWMRMN